MVLRRTAFGFLVLLTSSSWWIASVQADGPKYSGATRPLATPLLLRYGPTEFYSCNTVTRTIVRGSNKDTPTQYVVVEGTSVAIGESLELRFSSWLGENSPLVKITSDP